MIFAPKFTRLNEEFLSKKLEERKELNAFRRLRLPSGATDFCSNDYLGIATNTLIEKILSGHPATVPENSARGPEQGPDFRTLSHGSTGSRLLAGNYPLIEETENALASFHQAATGLIFNSGYDANLGLLSSVPQRGDTVLYDYLSHASIRDGMRLSFARSFSFGHNDTEDLEMKLKGARAAGGNIFVVTESVFSMDGDEAPLEEISSLCRRYEAHLVVDEAHATGIIGEKGEGLVQSLGLQDECLARIHTFGKALGCHGAILLGSARLRDWLINFSRAFIYTTALPPSSIAAIRASYELFPEMHAERQRLRQLIDRFQQASMRYERLVSRTPIQGVVVPGNEEVKKLAEQLQSAGLDVRPILYPTVPLGSERLRIVLHSFNSAEDLDALTGILRAPAKNK